MSRAVPYVAKPTEALLQRFSEAADARIYVVQEPGPTSFVLKSADSERKHRVSIGSVHSCSCGAREQPCVHTSFVLLRIFRLPAGDQRAWQGGLLDSELERIIEERARTTAARRQQQRMAAAPVATASGGGGGAPRPGEVAQREIDDANKEPCPICYEDISCEDQQAGKLEWCRLGCGKSVHRACMTVWSDHQASIGKKLTCPLCRNDWARGAPAPAAAAAPSSAAARGAGGAVHRHARCRSCRASPLYGRRYRCLLCPDRLELCEDCFEAGMHRQHPFASRERPGGAWSLAVREQP